MRLLEIFVWISSIYIFYHTHLTWHVVAYISFSDYRIKETNIAEIDITGGTNIYVYLSISTQTEVFIETITALFSDLCWCSCNILSTNNHAIYAIIRHEFDAVFSWKGEILVEYWEFTLNTLICPKEDDKGHGTDLIVGDGVTWLFSYIRVRRHRTCSLRMVLSPNPSTQKILNSIFSDHYQRPSRGWRDK